jgi:hypothetical protein
MRGKWEEPIPWKPQIPPNGQEVTPLLYQKRHMILNPETSEKLFCAVAKLLPEFESSSTPSCRFILPYGLPARDWPSGPCGPLLSPMVPLSRRILSGPST